MQRQLEAPHQDGAGRSCGSIPQGLQPLGLQAFGEIDQAQGLQPLGNAPALPDDLPECLRWMIRHRKRPYLDSSGTGTWFNAETIAEGLGDPESDIPAAVYALLKGGRETGHHKTFSSVLAAEESFEKAWTRAREQGWIPPD